MARGERGEADVQGVLWQGRVSTRDRQAAAFLGLDVQNLRHFHRETLKTLGFRQLTPASSSYYGSNPKFSCARHEYLHGLPQWGGSSPCPQAAG